MAESQPSGRLPWWRRHWLALTGLGLIVLLAYAVLAATVLPHWIVSVSGAKAGEDARLEAIVDTRSALLGVLAPVVVAIGAAAAFLNYELNRKALEATQRQNRDALDVTRRGQLTERFTKAIDQLGQTAEDKLDIRLGGIYALEQIARESPELHGPVMEILIAFLREHSRESPTTQADPAATEGAAPLRADFQAIATVLGRRQVSHEPEDFRLDLRGVILGRANFYGARLPKAFFWGAQLQGAGFFRAQLQGARFAGAQLQGARLTGAQLQGAYFARAQLEGASFEHADLEGADFRVGETDENDALGLTPEQLDLALNVDKAVLPNYVAVARESKRDDRSAE